MLIIPVVVWALCLWTGYGLFQLIGPRNLRLDVPGGLFLYGIAGALILGWIALVTAEMGTFSALAITLLGTLVGTIGWLATHRRGARVRLDFTRSNRTEKIFLVALIILTGVLYFRPHEFIFGGADAGVYVNLGAQLSRSGHWVIFNPDLAAIPSADYPMLFREQPPNQIPRYYQLPGFYIADSNAGMIIPQFYPLHTIWLAIAHGLGGVWANLFMTPLWGILGVLAFYFAVRETFAMPLATLASSLLALTPLQIWFARYPTAEVLTQFLMFSGLYAFARYARHGEKWAAILAGLALGQVMLARLDTYFVLGALIVYPAFLYLRGKLDQRFWYFALPMLAMGAHSLIHAVWQGWPYFYNVYSGGASLLPLLPAILGGLALVTVAFAIFARTLVRRSGWEAHVQSGWRVLLLTVSVSLMLLALYAYFVLPLQADPTRKVFYWYAQHDIPDVEPYNLVRMGWYLSPLGVALGVLGMALLVREQLTEHTWLLIGVGVFFSVLYLYRTFNNPHHVYVMRRYVPMVIPTFALGIAYSLIRLAGLRPFGRWVSIGLTITQVALLLYAGRIIIRQIDYRGGIEQFQVLSSLVPDRAIVLFNDNRPVGTAGIFGTPLAYLDGYTVIDLQEDRIDLTRLDALIMDWLAEQRPVVVIEGPSRVAGLCDRWQCNHLGTTRFDTPLLESSYEHFPKAVVHMRYNLELYLVKSVQL